MTELETVLEFGLCSCAVEKLSNKHFNFSWILIKTLPQQRSSDTHVMVWHVHSFLILISLQTSRFLSVGSLCKLWNMQTHMRSLADVANCSSFAFASIQTSWYVCQAYPLSLRNSTEWQGVCATECLCGVFCLPLSVPLRCVVHCLWSSHTSIDPLFTRPSKTEPIQTISTNDETISPIQNKILACNWHVFLQFPKSNRRKCLREKFSFPKNKI